MVYSKVFERLYRLILLFDLLNNRLIGNFVLVAITCCRVLTFFKNRFSRDQKDSIEDLIELRDKAAEMDKKGGDGGSISISRCERRHPNFFLDRICP